MAETTGREVATGTGLLDEALAAVPAGAVTDTGAHVNAPALVVRADSVEATLRALRDDLGLDHLACVTGQAYGDRYESIYHLRSYDDPTRELSVVVPAPASDPTSESGAAVFAGADWHEREAYDLVGIEYDDHPDLRRILLPETWQGHPHGPDWDGQQPQIVTLREHENPLRDDYRAEDSDTMFINIGPHPPATHGVLHVGVTLDGEQVAGVEPDLGYIHRCEEQMCQQGTYRHQIMPYPDRWDWGGAGLCNEWAYARAAEDLADIEVPEYARLLRTMGAELSRMLSHFLAVGTYALDVVGEFTATFMYAIQERERLQNILEDLTGQRLMFNYFRLGGVAWDVPDPRAEFFESVREFLDGLPDRLAEYHDLMTANEVFQIRTVDTGVLPPEEAKSFGATGPVARGSGVDYDLRRDDPYGYYDRLEWDVVTRTAVTTLPASWCACGNSNSRPASSSSASTCWRTGPRTSGRSRPTSRGRSGPTPTPRCIAPSRPPKGSWVSTSGATARTRPPGSRSAAPLSRTWRRSRPSRGGSTSPT